MLKLTDHELHRLADEIRRAARHGQIDFWKEDLSTKTGFATVTLDVVDVVAEGSRPAHVEVTLT